MEEPKLLLKVSNIKKYFPLERGIFSKSSGWIKAVDGVSFDIQEGETVGLVGESGCGKTTLGRTILRLLEPTEGEILFQDRKLNRLNAEELRKFRPKMQIIFQDPYSSLNPRMTAGYIIGESLAVHGIAKKRKERGEMVENLLERVGLSPRHANWYPHEFSGGMRQRIGIARALALKPKFIVCDEPVSSLDVSIQAQIINLLKDLQEELKLSYLFISHDLRVVGHISNRIAVMYLGKLVEIADKEELFTNPVHPYTKILFDAIPKIGVMERKKKETKAQLPVSYNGCNFYPRCPKGVQKCTTEAPRLEKKGENHFVACHLA
ncbi:MAG: ATP-binding cassette domain-containing protein [Candidatus Ratteibacteria bacterium]|nr:ATP-binding cassette domain-containing protein [Candidatus Ratteibacteria bacterium]